MHFILTQKSWSFRSHQLLQFLNKSFYPNIFGVGNILDGILGCKCDHCRKLPTFYPSPPHPREDRSIGQALAASEMAKLSHMRRKELCDNLSASQ